MGWIRRSLTQARSKNIPNQNLESVSFGPEELAGRAGLGTPFSPASLPSTKVREPSSAEYISMIRTAILLLGTHVLPATLSLLCCNKEKKERKGKFICTYILRCICDTLSIFFLIINFLN